jgi:hypothetical protein
MTPFNGNGIYLSINGITAAADAFKSVDLKPKIDTVDTTRGAGTTHVQRATGLDDFDIAIEIGYEVETIQTQLGFLRPGRYTVIFGPEGNGSGKPRHQQDFIFTEAPLKIEVKKSEVAFSMKGIAAAAPVFNMYGGATFP